MYHILTSMYSETPEDQNKVAPAAGKKMRDVVPYTEIHQKLLEKIGFDIADDIPDEHEEDAEFVISRSVEYRFGTGKYTGWMRNGLMNGKGTFIADENGDRFDSLWKDSLMHGTGRFMWGNGIWAEQGACADDTWAKPRKQYHADGLVLEVK